VRAGIGRCLWPHLERTARAINVTRGGALLGPGRDRRAAIVIGLIGTLAEPDDPEYSIPDLLEDNDDPAVTNLMKIFA
jgi:hypothetical protein